MLSTHLLLPLLLLSSLQFVTAARRCKLRHQKPSSSYGDPGSNCRRMSKRAPGRVSTTWYAGWHGSQHTAQDISWEKYTEVIYAFAITTPDGGVSLDPSDEQQLPTFVSLAHQHNVKATLSIGGWTGSRYFSVAVGNEANRTAFVNAVLGLVSKFNLDGLDFDWEYPNREGIGCNIMSPQDSSNYLAFLQALRAEPAGEKLTLSAAAGITPFMGPDGTPLNDVSQFAEVFDFVTIMNYDVWGSWTTLGVGPNAPLDDTCASAGQQQGSAVSAVAAWTAAKFPADKLVLGVASYGHSFRVSTASAFGGGAAGATSDGSGSGSNQLTAYPQFDASAQPAGDTWDGAPGTDVCGNSVPQGGIWNFWGLIQGGFLDAQGKPAQGISYRYDDCSQTPYVYNPNTQVMVSYDDATSFAAKGAFIVDSGLAGFAMWQAGGDSNDILLDSIRAAVGSAGAGGGC